MTIDDADVARHFDSIANQYDLWKQRHWYYYRALKAIAGAWSAGARHVLDVGCGTGAILASLGESTRVGVDLSQHMTAIAKARNISNTSFFTADIVSFSYPRQFDLVLMFDVIEHLAGPAAALASVARLIEPGGRLVITMANPSWEPLLLLAERLGLKMPEGPHYRISSRTLIESAEGMGLDLVKRQWRLLFPAYLPLLSFILNDLIGRLPLLRRLSLIEVFVFERRRQPPARR